MKRYQRIEVWLLLVTVPATLAILLLLTPSSQLSLGGKVVVGSALSLIWIGYILLRPTL